MLRLVSAAEASFPSIQEVPRVLNGRIVPTPGSEEPFKVVFKQGSDVLAEWPVASEEIGEQRIKRALAAIAASSAGYAERLKAT